MVITVDASLTRRRFLGSAAAASLALAPALSACGSNGSGAPPSASTSPDDGATATGTLRVSNWPLYIAEGFVADFQKASGLTVDYREDYNDDEQWFAKNKEPLSRGQDIGCDLVIPSEVIVGRLNRLGWLTEIRETRWPNKANLQPALLDGGVDPGRKVSAPYMSGIVGLAYNRAATGRELHRIDDLWDPAFKGRVSMLSDTLDGLGMVMMADGGAPDAPTDESVRRAVDIVRDQKDRGQIRRFTGNDYTNDLASGNVVVAQAYSGDVVQLQADNPDLQFVIPDSGGTLTLQSMVLPRTTQNPTAAEAWIDYVYDRANYAKLVAYTQYIPVLTDMTDALNAVDPNAASNPLINPSADTLRRVKQWATLTDEQVKAFNDAYAAVTGS